MPRPEPAFARHLERLERSEEVLVAPPAPPIAPLTAVRGTLIVASLKTFEKRGYRDRYFAMLPAQHHAAIREAMAGSWLASDLATAHYKACDALGLSSQEVFAIGAEVGERVRATLLGTLATLAREAGTTPWLYLERLPRMFPRVVIGGAVAVYKLGPKEARIEWYGLPGMEIAYFRTAFRGANQAIVALFCTKAYVSETAPLRGGDRAFKVSWA